MISVVRATQAYFRSSKGLPDEVLNPLSGFSQDLCPLCFDLNRICPKFIVSLYRVEENYDRDFLTRHLSSSREKRMIFTIPLKTTVSREFLDRLVGADRKCDSATVIQLSLLQELGRE